jgi:hypothetical protein
VDDTDELKTVFQQGLKAFGNDRVIFGEENFCLWHT